METTDIKSHAENQPEIRSELEDADQAVVYLKGGEIRKVDPDEIEEFILNNRDILEGRSYKRRGPRRQENKC